MEQTNGDNRNYRERASDFLRDKGVYLVLLVCIAIIGIAAAAAYLPGRQEEAEQVAQSEDQRLAEAAATPRPAPTPSPSPSPSPSPAPTGEPEAAAEAAEEPGEPARPAEPTPTPIPARTKADPPVKGEVQWRYAMDELVYSKTLDQWMTHSGVDLSAAQGAEVHAVWPGAVEEVYEDDSLGITVRLSHSDGRESIYSNLRSDVKVEEGRRVAQGEVLGFVGDTARSECAQEPHLHFEVYKDGETVNPLDYIITTG